MKSEVRNATFYSSCLLGHGGVGEVQLFTVPQGQPIPGLFPSDGKILPAQTAKHTNVMRAGMLASFYEGVAVGSVCVYVQLAKRYEDGSFSPTGATPNDMETIRQLTLEFRVAGVTLFSGPIWNLKLDSSPEEEQVAKDAEIPKDIATYGYVARQKLEIPILVGGMDTTKFVVRTDNPLNFWPSKYGKKRTVLLSVALQGRTKLPPVGEDR